MIKITKLWHRCVNPLLSLQSAMEVVDKTHADHFEKTADLFIDDPIYLPIYRDLGLPPPKWVKKITYLFFMNTQFVLSEKGIMQNYFTKKYCP